MMDALRVLVWIDEGGAIDYRVGVEHHNIRHRAFLNSASIVESNAVGRHPGHLVYRRLQRQHAEFPDVAPQHARMGAVVARVRVRITRRLDAAVGIRNRGFFAAPLQHLAQVQPVE